MSSRKYPRVERVDDDYIRVNLRGATLQNRFRQALRDYAERNRRYPKRALSALRYENLIADAQKKSPHENA
jgi:hypothetical protein